MHKLALEIIRGKAGPEGFKSADMERGHRLEDEARQLYAFMKDIDPERIGFVRNGKMGASPDSFVGAKGGLEIKTALPHIQMERLIKQTLPTEHKAQVQGLMLVCERDSWDFLSFPAPYEPDDPDPVPLPPFLITVARDDKYIRAMRDEIETFNDELEHLVDQMRALGTDPVKVAA